MKKVSEKIIGLGAALASFGALAFAYTAQFGFNLQPCILCLYQRKPYFAVIALGLTAAFVAASRPRVARVLLLLCGLCFTVGAGIGLFHTGVEHGWWQGLQACGDATLPENATLAEMQAYIANRPIVRCDVAAWKMFGITMSGYNALLSGALAVLTFVLTLTGRTAAEKARP